MEIIFIVCLALWFVALILCIRVVRYFYSSQREFDIEVQSSIRQIKYIAKKKNLNADNMIRNALKRLEDDLKSF